MHLDGHEVDVAERWAALWVTNAWYMQSAIAPVLLREAGQDEHAVALDHGTTAHGGTVYCRSLHAGLA